ncbi:MAG: hypothetical protein AB1505_13655 [Candidatus Latescibacterota bacterium]
MGAGMRIGWAHRDITPRRPVALRGQFNLRVATRVEDPLTLTVLALESGNHHAVFASADLCFIDAHVLEAARQRLAARLPALDPGSFVMGGTHTHTAPFTGARGELQDDRDYMEPLLQRHPDYLPAAEYGRTVVEALVDAVCQAWESRALGRIGYGYAHAVVGENRRVRYLDDRAVMYGSTAAADFSHVEGHVDHAVNLLCTYDGEERLTGVVVNLACPSQASESGQDHVSADYWHDVRQEVGRRRGAGVHVLPQCSAAGDQSPHRLIAKRAEERMLRLKYGGGTERPLNAALRRDIARRVAEALDDAEPAIRRDLRAEAEVACRELRLDLPHWDVTPAEYDTVRAQIAEAEQQLASLGDADPLDNRRTALHSRLGWCRAVAERCERPPASVPVRANVVRVGDVAFVTAPFEYYLDFGDRIKGRSPAVQTFVVQLAGGGPYLATARAAAGLSYGAVPASCLVAPAGGQVLAEAALAALGELFEAAPR